jgi:hypothetical protein
VIAVDVVDIPHLAATQALQGWYVGLIQSIVRNAYRVCFQFDRQMSVRGELQIIASTASSRKQSSREGDSISK